jgi:hypothetical protein
MVRALLLFGSLPEPVGQGLTNWPANPILKTYGQVGRWLKAHISPHSSVGALEIGLSGNCAQRRLFGFAGFNQSDIAYQFAPTSTYQDSATRALRASKPDHVALDKDTSSHLSKGDSSSTSCLSLGDYVLSRARLAASPEAFWLRLCQWRGEA